MAVIMNRVRVADNRKRKTETLVVSGVLLRDRPRLGLDFRISNGDWVVIINGGQPMIATDVEVELHVQLQDALTKIKKLESRQSEGV